MVNSVSVPVLMSYRGVSWVGFLLGLSFPDAPPRPPSPGRERIQPDDLYNQHEEYFGQKEDYRQGQYPQQSPKDFADVGIVGRHHQK